MKKVYICGPVSGLPYDEVVKKFAQAEQILKGMGVMPINPLHLVPDPETHWNPAMRACIKGLMDADAILMLDGYQQSKGANVEYELAKVLEMTVLHIEIRQSKMNNEPMPPVSEMKALIDAAQ